MAEHGSELNESGPQFGIPVSVKELDDVLFRDVGNKIANDGRSSFFLKTGYIELYTYCAIEIQWNLS